MSPLTGGVTIKDKIWNFSEIHILLLCCVLRKDDRKAKTLEVLSLQILERYCYSTTWSKMLAKKSWCHPCIGINSQDFVNWTMSLQISHNKSPIIQIDLRWANCTYVSESVQWESIRVHVFENLRDSQKIISRLERALQNK